MCAGDGGDGDDDDDDDDNDDNNDDACSSFRRLFPEEKQVIVAPWVTVMVLKEECLWC